MKLVKVSETKKKVFKQTSIRDYDLKIPKSGIVNDLFTNNSASINKYKIAKYGYTISNQKNQIYAYVKPATSEKMYFANGYLNGFVPYEVDNMWVILKYLQTRLKYQLDEVGYNKRKEVWQTAKESYIKLRGDCEDHAILLADWLIGLGYDARVVAGKVKFRGQKLSGHAWVVLFYEGKEYLLEATQKSKWNKLPLASTFPNYFPKVMFNRTKLWINTGSTSTTKYSDKKWKNSGKFSPKNPYYKDL